MTLERLHICQIISLFFDEKNIFPRRYCHQIFFQACRSKYFCVNLTIMRLLSARVQRVTSSHDRCLITTEDVSEDAHLTVLCAPVPRHNVRTSAQQQSAIAHIPITQTAHSLWVLPCIFDQISFIYPAVSKNTQEHKVQIVVAFKCQIFSWLF